MLTILLGVLIALFKTCRNDDLWKSTADYLLSAFFGAFCGLGAAIIIGLFLPTESYVSQETLLAAIQDGSQTTGSFFLGSGRIEEGTYYFFYAKAGEHSYVMDKRSTSNAVIVEDDPAQPYLREYAIRFLDDRSYYFGLPLHPPPPVEFHIPKGSILQNYRLDLR